MGIGGHGGTYGVWGVFLALFISSASMAQEQGTAKPDPPLVKEIVQGMPRG